MKQHLVLDNGLYNIKAGFAGEKEPLTVHNALAKARDGQIYVGNDYVLHSNLYLGINFKRPHELGNLTSWETEKVIWDYTFDQLLPEKELDTANCHLTLTETPFQLPQLLMNTDLIVFEEYGFSEYYRCVPQTLVPWLFPQQLDFSLVVDCGYSATWIVPVMYQSAYWKGVRKLPVGGRHLNGLLREIIAFRHYDILDEPMLLNTVKESTMYVARDFEAELKRKYDASCEFVLPDFKTTFTGFVKQPKQKLPDDAQTLGLHDERFTVPEAYFHPEIMLDNNSYSRHAVLQNANFKSVSDLVVSAIMACPEAARPLLLANINVIGGLSRLPGFSERLVSELKKELPTNWPVNAQQQNYPADLVAWHGGSALMNADVAKDVTISKHEYFEHGSNWCQKQFGFRNY